MVTELAVVATLDVFFS